MALVFFQFLFLRRWKTSERNYWWWCRYYATISLIMVKPSFNKVVLCIMYKAEQQQQHHRFSLVWYDNINICGKKRVKEECTYLKNLKTMVTWNPFGNNARPFLYFTKYICTKRKTSFCVFFLLCGKCCGWIGYAEKREKWAKKDKRKKGEWSEEKNAMAYCGMSEWRWRREKIIILIQGKASYWKWGGWSWEHIDDDVCLFLMRIMIIMYM